MLCLRSIDSGRTQDKTGGAVAANAQADDLLDLRGDLPNPRRINAAELHKLPRAETRTTDPHDPGKEIVYSGTLLVEEVLKAGGLLLDSGMAGIRETVTMTVLVEAGDGYRAAFSLAELDPELTDRVVLLGALGAPSQGGPAGQTGEHRGQPDRWNSWCDVRPVSGEISLSCLQRRRLSVWSEVRSVSEEISLSLPHQERLRRLEGSEAGQRGQVATEVLAQGKVERLSEVRRPNSAEADSMFRVRCSSHLSLR